MSIINLNEVSKSNVDLFAEPIFIQDDGKKLEGVKVLGNRYVDFNDIYIDDDNYNIVRTNGQSPAHINTLKTSFAQGVDTTQPPPALKIREGNTEKPYELLYGYGRVLAIMDLIGNSKGYVFSIIKCENESCELDVRLMENESLPKLNNQEIDIKKILNIKVNKGFIKNDESSIRKEMKRICNFRSKQVSDRIVQMVFEDCNTPQDYAFYNEVKAQLWVDNHSTENYMIGCFDPKVDGFIYLVKEGYQYRFIQNAIRNKAKYGKDSYCIAHVASPTKNASISQKRMNFIETLEEMTGFIRTSFSTSNVFWKVLGFLPQEKGKDNWKELVQIT